MDWAWVDRALTTLWVGDTGGDPAVARAYRALHEAARARRDQLDEQFAARLASWVPRASAKIHCCRKGSSVTYTSFPAWTFPT